MHSLRDWAVVCLLGGSLNAHVAVAQSGPGPADSVSPARVAPAFNAQSRCPDVRQSDLDDNSAAIVQFYVGPTGVPSRVSIKSSSQSDALDSAALACVPKLRFLPATRLGDGGAVGSWQVIAWKAGPPPRADAAAVAPAAGSAAAATAAAVPAAPRSAGPAAPERRAEVRVCVDDAGKLLQDPQLTRSSGDAQFDQSAVSVAKAGSGYYRGGTAAGSATPGCLQISVRAEKK
jgi:TonB family protein